MKELRICEKLYVNYIMYTTDGDLRHPVSAQLLVTWQNSIFLKSKIFAFLIIASKFGY